MLKEAKLGKAARKLLSITRVAFCATSGPLAGPLLPGLTRLGGTPDAPVGFEWPVVSGVALRFVAQLDLAELARLEAPDTQLPTRGLLSFFVCDQLSDEPDAPGYLEVARVFHFDVEPRTLRPLAVPQALVRRADGKEVTGVDALTAPCALTFHLRLQLPPPSHPAVRALGLGEDELQRYRDDVFTMPRPTHQLLGYRTRDTEEQEDSVLLLQLISDDRAQLRWGDLDELTFSLSREALVARDFTAVVPRCGE